MAAMILNRLFRRKRIPEHETPLTGEQPQASTERGYRSTPEDYLKYLYRIMWVDPDLRQAVLDIRDMDRRDGRVKKIHARMARTAVKGGLQLATSSQNKTIIDAWKRFENRLGLANPQKLESDARALVMEGNLMLQTVLDGETRVAQAIRMPSETFLPKVAPNGVFLDPQNAWEQYDLTTGVKLAGFALWEIAWARLTPDNFDDMGSRGRPYLDASRTVWKQLRMTEDDLVIRRRTRAPLRMAHVLEGATKDDLDDYRRTVEEDQDRVTTDYYLNRKGGVQAVQGDANLDQIADVAYLLDTFFAGAPAPKGLFGYSGDLNRDILEDLKRDYYEEIDAIQDIQAHVYEQIFRFDLLLQGINPDEFDFYIEFAERRTDTPNQRADLALKYQAMGVPREIVWKSAGLNPAEVRAQREAELDEDDPYPDPFGPNPQPGPRVSITPGNRPKGESATSISND
jgi:hypothetical protein